MYKEPKKYYPKGVVPTKTNHRGCRWCEEGALRSDDQDLIDRKAWVKPNRNFKFDHLICDDCVKQYSELNKLNPEFFKSRQFFHTWHITMLLQIKREIKRKRNNEGVVSNFKEYNNNFEMHSLQLYKIMDRDWENWFGTSRTWISHMRNIILNEELRKSPPIKIDSKTIKPFIEQLFRKR